MKKDKKNKTHINPPPQPTKKPTETKRRINYGVPAIALFFVATFAVLFCFYGDYMRKVESLSLFLSTPSYLSQCMRVPGGALLWAGTFLNQCFYYPWLGASVYALLLSAIAVVSVYAFKIPKSWVPAAIIPTTLILLAFTNLGYLIFSLKPVGYSFTLPLGILVAVSLMALYRLARPWWLRMAAVIVIVCGGYPLFGFFALLAAAMCAVSTILPSKTEKYWRRILPLVAAAAAVAFFPHYWFYHVDGDLILSQTYITPLPRFYANEAGWKIFYTVIFAIYLIWSAFGEKLPGALKGKLTRLPSAAALAAIACIFIFRYSDKNFNLTLKLDRAIWDQNWAEAERLADALDTDPTRINTVLSYIAMMRNGDAGQKMFGIIDAKAPYNTSRGVSAFSDAVGPLVAYHLGLINYAYRWGMEYTIGQGESVERLKIMTKCALLNYELDLARTYLDILYNTPMHRAWAKKYMRYVKNPIEIAADPELSTIAQLMCHKNEFINDGGAFESYVWTMLANTDKGTPQFNELSMQAALVSRDLDKFIEKIPDYAKTHQRIPRYYQEAALLWSLLVKQPCPIRIDPAIEQLHDKFLNAFRSTSHMEAELQREAMRETFADTFWFYYVFNDDMLLK